MVGRSRVSELRFGHQMGARWYLSYRIEHEIPIILKYLSYRIQHIYFLESRLPCAYWQSIAFSFLSPPLFHFNSSNLCSSSSSLVLLLFAPPFRLSINSFPSFFPRPVIGVTPCRLSYLFLFPWWSHGRKSPARDFEILGLVKDVCSFNSSRANIGYLLVAQRISRPTSESWILSCGCKLTCTLVKYDKRFNLVATLRQWSKIKWKGKWQQYIAKDLCTIFWWKLACFNCVHDSKKDCVQQQI